MGWKVSLQQIPPVAWDQVCKSKVEGGLGIRECDKWNKAAIGKLIQNTASKPNSLWVKWVNHTYLKDQLISPPHDATWSLKKLHKVAMLFAPAYNGMSWNRHVSGVYTIKSGYEWLKDSSPKVEWSTWVWNNFNVPKHIYDMLAGLLR